MILKPIKRRLARALKSKRLMSFLMVKLLISIRQDSWLQKLFSIQASLRREMKPQVCTPWLSKPLMIAIWMLEMTSLRTSFSPEELLYIMVSQTESRKNSTLFTQNLELLKSLPLPIDTTQSGPVVPLFHPSPPSKLNGSPRMSTKKMVLRSSIENVYE